jgi:hypothetical protein
MVCFTLREDRRGVKEAHEKGGPASWLHFNPSRPGRIEAHQDIPLLLLENDCVVGLADRELLTLDMQRLLNRPGAPVSEFPAQGYSW